MEDQATQNASMDAANGLCHWKELNALEKATALLTLSEYLEEHRELPKSLEIDLEAELAAQWFVQGDSRIPWDELSPNAFAEELRAIAESIKAIPSEFLPTNEHLRDDLMDLAEHLERQQR